MDSIKNKSQRLRSPNYPSYSLRECVIFLERLYTKYKGNEIHTDDAIIQMGHSPTSSTASRALASLFSFGLLDSRGTSKSKFVRASLLGQEILLEEENSLQRITLLQKALLTDSSMLSIYEKWGTDIPAEETIKKSLQIEMGYSAEGAKRFASVIVESYEYAQLNNSKNDFTVENKENKTIVIENHDKVSNEEISSSNRKANLLLPGKNREILIYAPSDLSEKEFDLIFKWLELQKYGLVTSPPISGSND
jgi:hypothetical protein